MKRILDEEAFNEYEKLRKIWEDKQSQYVEAAKLNNTNEEHLRSLCEEAQDAHKAWQEYLYKHGHKFLFKQGDE